MLRRVMLLATCIAGVASAQTPRSAPISGVHYEVTFNSATARARAFDVSMSFDVADRNDVLLSLPAWTPGAYELSDFARNVVEFAATQNGAPVRWEKHDHDTWRIHPAARGRVTVKFRYMADSLDNAGAWTRSDFLLFNGTTAFMYPEGGGFDWPATVGIRTDDRWRVATAMPELRRPGGERIYREDNYHDLVDHPFFVGAFEMDSATVAGKWMRFATYPAGSVAGELRRRLWAALQRMTPPMVSVFGDVPWQTYTILQIADSSFGGAAGLEHQDSHVDIVAAQAVDNPFMLSLYAHEIVHAWNVKRLRPAEMTPYRYDERQPTPLLWVAEGVTDYYADLSLVRGGVVDSSDFLETTEGKVRNVTGLPATSLEDASVSTWVSPRDGTHYVYYDHGSLAGLLLDVLIRDATDNQRSLDDVMRELYRATASRERGFTNDEWWATVDRIGGRSFADFRARYVDGRERLPYADVLPLAAIRVNADTARQLRVGVFSVEDQQGVRIVRIQPGSVAEAADVRPGDYLLAVGDVRVTSADFSAQFRTRYASTPMGTALPIRVRRGDQELTLPGTLQSTTEVTYRLAYDPGASAKAKRIRGSLLRGH